MKTKTRYSLIAVFSVLAFSFPVKAVDEGSVKNESGKTEAQSASTAHGANNNPPPISALKGGSGSHDCLVDEVALEDIKKNNLELTAQKKLLDERQKELDARELALKEEIKKLTVIKEEISKIDSGIKKEAEEKVNKLVESIEGMSPKAAAVLLSQVDENLAVEAMFKLSTLKLSKILQIMEPSKAAKLSEILAGVARAKKPSGSNGPSGATEKGKGGEKI